MTTFYIIIIAVLMGLTLYSLVRGIVAFMQSTRTDLERPDSDGPSKMQLLQSKMMFRRILFQGATILVVIVLLKASQN